MAKGLFPKTIFGYNVKEVEQGIEKLNEEIRQLNVDLKLEEVVGQELTEQVDRYKDKEAQIIEIPMEAQNRVRDMFASASETSLKMKEKYNEQCEEWLAKNKEDYAYLDQTLKGLLSRRETMITTLEKLLERYIADLDRISISLEDEYEFETLDMLEKDSTVSGDRNVICFPLPEFTEDDIPVLTVRKVE